MGKRRHEIAKKERLAAMIFARGLAGDLLVPVGEEKKEAEPENRIVKPKSEVLKNVVEGTILRNFWLEEGFVELMMALQRAFSDVGCTEKMSEDISIWASCDKC